MLVTFWVVVEVLSLAATGAVTGAVAGLTTTDRAEALEKRLVATGGGIMTVGLLLFGVSIWVMEEIAVF